MQQVNVRGTFLLTQACLPPPNLSPHWLGVHPAYTLVGGVESARDPEIMADAAVAMLDRACEEITGKALLDSEILAQQGITDLTRYGGGSHPPVDIPTRHFVSQPTKADQCESAHAGARR